MKMLAAAFCLLAFTSACVDDDPASDPTAARLSDDPEELVNESLAEMPDELALTLEPAEPTVAPATSAIQLNCDHPWQDGCESECEAWNEAARNMDAACSGYIQWTCRARTQEFQVAAAALRLCH